MTPRIYVAGPMSGIKDYNYPAFNDAAAKLANAGYVALNPATNFSGRTDLPRHVYFHKDFALLLRADGICLLEGWQQSAGAKAEYVVAVELGLYQAHVAAYVLPVVHDDVCQHTAARRRELDMLGESLW